MPCCCSRAPMCSALLLLQPQRARQPAASPPVCHSVFNRLPRGHEVAEPSPHMQELHARSYAAPRPAAGLDELRPRLRGKLSARASAARGKRGEPSKQARRACLGVAVVLADGRHRVAQVPELQRGALVIVAGHHELRRHLRVPLHHAAPLAPAAGHRAGRAGRASKRNAAGGEQPCSKEPRCAPPYPRRCVREPAYKPALPPPPFFPSQHPPSPPSPPAPPPPLPVGTLGALLHLLLLAWPRPHTPPSKCGAAPGPRP